MKKLNVITFLLFSFSFTFLLDKYTKAADVKIFQTNGMVNWNDEKNFSEAKKISSMIEEIYKEKQKQQQDTNIDKKQINYVNNNSTQKSKNENLIIEHSDNINIGSDEKNNVYTKNITSKNKNDEDEDIKSELIASNVEKQDNSTGKNEMDFTINDYDFHGKNGFSEENSHTQNIDDVVIDLSIVPQIPKIKHNVKTTPNDSKEYDDFRFSRMLQKAGENIDNIQNFALFSREAAKIASKSPTIKQQVLFIPEIDTDANKENKLNLSDKELNTNFAHAENKNINSFTKNNLQQSNTYNKKLHNMYAIAEKINKERNKAKSDPSKINSNSNSNHSENTKIKSYDNTQSSDDFIEGNNNGNNKKSNTQQHYTTTNEDLNEGLVDEYSDIEYKEESIEQKQLRAKDIGAPYPLKRSNNYHLTQYQPQNIAQVYHDKNNQHLTPIIFEKHVVEQVIDSLGEPNSTQIARALIDKLGKVDITDDDGNTLLMHAVARKNKPLISMLLSEGASPNAKNKDGFTPIHLASSNGDDFAVYSLMMSGGNPNLADNDGNTPLMYAAKMCNDNSIKIMIALGGDPSIINSFNGLTAFDFAKENKNHMVYKLLETTSKQLYGKTKPVILND